MAGQNELMAWLQSVMPNQGAQQPYGPGGLVRYGTGPGDLGMGDSRGMTANTPGAPSMGYPAMGAPVAQPQPQQGAQAGGGVLDWLRGVGGAIGDAGATGGDPYALTNPQPPGAPASPGGPGPRLLAAASANPAAGIGDYPDSTNYPHAMTPPRFDWPASSTPTGMPSPTPEGSPSDTPTPADSTAPLPPKRPRAKGPLAGAPGADNGRFPTFHYDVPGSGRGAAPIYTALRLGGRS